MTRITIVNAPSRLGVYQSLANDLAAIEPPVWALLTAEYLRNAGHDVTVIDGEALGYTTEETARAIVRSEPQLVVFAIYGQQPSASTQCMPGAIATLKFLKFMSFVPTVAMGTHPSALPERTILDGFDYVVKGEGPREIAMLADTLGAGISPRILTAPLIEDLSAELPRQAWDLVDMTSYRAHNWHVFGREDTRNSYASLQTSLGCPFRCLAGDTKINTVYGEIAIKELAEKYPDGVPVFTYNPSERRALVSLGRSIRKYGENEKLVRVLFDDGTHIDCTPDHRFLAFKWGNQTTPEREWECEAQHLAPGQHVRAIRFELSGPKNAQYPDVTWSRRGRKRAHRMVAEYMLGRFLQDGEVVHHLNHDRLDFAPENLQVVSSTKEHFAHHPEVAERMRTNNPVKNMTPEWRAKITDAVTGKKRSLESRLRYSESKKGEKNPNYKHGNRSGVSTRLPPNNHRVVSVTPLEGLHDVYCLEVPETGWFYANNVLVHNCEFCCINAPFGSAGLRCWSVDNVIAQLDELVGKYNIRNIKIPDEMFVLNPKRVMELCERIIERFYAVNFWAYARVDTLKDDRMLDLLKRAGFNWLGVGIESGSKHVRDGVEKGRFGNEDIVKTIARVKTHGIHIAANYIFGLPDDTHESLHETLALARELNTPWANFYCAMAYPGSPLHATAVQNGWRLPEDGPGWIGYAQHAYDCTPLRTETLSTEEVLDFRDRAFVEYFSDPSYRMMMQQTFGQRTDAEIEQMLSHTVRRKHREAA